MSDPINPANPVDPNTVAVPVTPAANPIQYPPRWLQVVGEFSRNLRKDLDSVSIALISVVGDPSDEGAEMLLNSRDVPDSELQRIAEELRVPSAFRNKAIANLRSSVAPTPSANPVAGVNVPPSVPGAGFNPVAFNRPPLPTQENLLMEISQQTTLIASPIDIAGLASSFVAYVCGYFTLPRKIHDAMIQTASELDMAYTDDFYKAEAEVLSEKHSNVFKLLGYSISRRHLSKKNTELVLSRFKDVVGATKRVFELSGAWQKNVIESAGPAAMMQMMQVMMAGGAAAMGALPQNRPDSTHIHQAVEGVKLALNNAFKQHGVACARFLTAKSQNIIAMTREPNFHTRVNAQTRELAFKKLGINISPEHARLFTTLPDYIADVLHLLTLTPGSNEEMFWIYQLQTKGSTIDFDFLERAKISLDGSVGAGEDDEDEDDDSDLLVAKTTNKKAYRQY